MTNEEAREILEKLIPQPQRGDGKSITHLMITEALTMAIKALEQEPCEDRISENCTSEDYTSEEEVADIILSIARNLEHICEVIRNDTE